MAQATFSIRMDEDLKKEFDALCEDFGMSATTAFNVFARAVVRERKIPFEIEASDSLSDAMFELRKDAEQKGQTGMSLEEINAIIDKVRKGAD